MIITATFPASITAELGDEPATGRTITGVAVPYNQVGTVSDGRKVKFLPGSLDENARPVVMLGHDGAAIGRVTSNVSDDTGMRTTVKVSAVPAGDNALILASDGVLSMFSVGAEPTDFTHDGDTMIVAAADWRHLALLAEGAFSQAVVETVAASTPTGETPMTDTSLVVADPPATQIEAAPAIIPVTSRPLAPPLTLSRIANLVAQANRGEISTEAVKASIQAALANVLSTGVGAIVPPAYRSEITGIVDHGTPLINHLSNGTLPAAGMSLEWPQWNVLPTTGIQATEKTAITSTAASFTLKTSPVVTIAGGNDLSLQSVERSSPSFLEAYLKAMAVDWGRRAEAYVLSVVTPLAVVATPGTTFIGNVKALLSALNPAVTPAGGLFVAMSYDVALSTIDVTTANGPAFWSGAVNFGDMTPEVSGSGIDFFVDVNLPIKTMIGGSKDAVVVYKSSGAPADIRVVDVSLLGLDVGVYGYLAVAVQYPGALAILTTA